MTMEEEMAKAVTTDRVADLVELELHAADIEEAEALLAGRELPVPEGPEPFMSGTFALYATPKGDVVLATSTDLTGEKTVKVPRLVVAQAKRGNPMLAEILDRARKAG